MKILRITLIFFLLWGCSSAPEDINETGSRETPDKSIRGFVLTERRGEKKDWQLKAENAELLKVQEKEIIEVSNYTMNFFEENSPVSRLHGDEGIYDRETQVFHAPSRVEIVSEEKKIITSDVRWQPDEDIFTTDRKVEIQTPQGVVTGMGMTASKDLERINIREKISGELQRIDTN